MTPVEAYLRRTTIEGAEEIIRAVTATEWTSRRMASHLGYQTRVINRVAVPHLTAQGRTVKEISARLGINERNVKAHRAAQRKRLNEMSVDSAGENRTA